MVEARPELEVRQPLPGPMVRVPLVRTDFEKNSMLSLIKKTVRKGLNHLGYEVHLLPKPGEAPIPIEYASLLPFHYARYQPWFEDWISKEYSEIKNNTCCFPDHCYLVAKFSRSCLHLEGDFIECGTYRGGTAHLIASEIKSTPSRPRELHLFDTFTGMPPQAVLDPSGHREGDLGDVDFKAVQAFLKPFPFIRFHQGIIPATFEAIQSKKFAFAHIDVDLYSSVMDSCQFLYERMTPGGIMVFDDYGFEKYRNSAKKAVDDFFRDKVESPIIMGTAQCIVIKSAVN